MTRLMRPFTVLVFLALFFVVSLLFFSTSCPTMAQEPTPTPICADRSSEELGIMPNTVWVEVQDHWTEWPNADRPFASEFDFDFYVYNTLLGEMGPQIYPPYLPSEDYAWDDATLQALTVAIRTHTWHRFHYAGQYSDPHPITLDNINQCGFYDDIPSGGAQRFRPHYQGASQEVKSRYEAIANDLANVYLVEEGAGLYPIDAQFRNTTTENNWTTEGNRDYLHSVYDPISTGDTSSGSGLGQWGAQRWAMGQDDAGNAFPQWDHYEQILAHYYTGIHILGDGPYSPYRWNPIEASVTVGGDPFLRIFNISALPQNTGIYPWENNQNAFTTQLMMQVGSSLVPVVGSQYQSTPVTVDGVQPGDVPAPVELISTAYPLFPIAPAYYLRLDMEHDEIPFSRSCFPHIDNI